LRCVEMHMWFLIHPQSPTSSCRALQMVSSPWLLGTMQLHAHLLLVLLCGQAPSSLFVSRPGDVLPTKHVT
jgi:hypothetical protein